MGEGFIIGRHITALIERGSRVDGGAEICQFTVVREQASILTGTHIASHCYIDSGVSIGESCKIKNGVRIFRGWTVQDGVFIGPGAMLLNDKYPDANDPHGPPYPEGVVQKGATIGAGAIIMPGIVIGERAMVGAGAVVTKDVLPETKVYGVPARDTFDLSRL